MKLIEGMIQTVDLAVCEEWKLDHGIMVPLHHLAPHNDLPIIPININCQARHWHHFIAHMRSARQYGALPMPCRRALRLSVPAAFHTGHARRTLDA